MKRHRRGIVTAIAAAAALLSACAAPRPERPVQAWSYVGTRLPSYWWYTLVDIGGARAKEMTGSGRNVAILDTGVLPGHEDLKVVGAGAATCGSNSADTTDVNGHGTQLAGIAVGRDPGRATRGAAPDAQLIPIKVSCGLVTADALTRGVDGALARRADIVLLAVGGYPTGPPDVAAFLADRIAKNPGVLFVVASVWAGARYPLPQWTRQDNAIVVAPMTLDDYKREVAFLERQGDIWAPGRDVETADIVPDPVDSKFHAQYMMQGSSAASAIVAGCAALVKARTGQGGAALKTALIGAAEVKPDLGAPDRRRLNCARAIP